jgi:peroxiredoxin
MDGEDETTMAKQLKPGDLFPDYTVQLTDGRTVNIPHELKGEYALIIFYRGIW